MNAGGDPMLLENGDDSSSASGLTVDHEHHDENDGTEDAEVTLLDAVAGLRRTLVGFALDNGTPNTDNVTPAPPIETSAELPVVIQNTAPENDGNHVDNQDDENSSIEFSIDLSAQGLTNMFGNGGADEAPVTAGTVGAPTNNSELRNVIVEMPQSPNVEPNQLNNQNEEEVQQREIDLEGRILSEAASAAVANFTAQAATVARETASEAVGTTSSWFIRAGSLTGLIAGGGGIVAAVLTNHRVQSNFPLSVTLGTMSGLIRNNGDSVSSPSGGASERRSGYPSAVYGLFATSAFGFVGAGLAYLVRNQVRASIAETREKRLEDAAKTDDEANKKP